MTHCLSFIAHLNQCGEFKHRDIAPTVDGIRGVYVDKNDGQHYEVVVRPIGSPSLKCRLCKEERPAEEIMRNSGDCDFCNLQRS